MCIAHCSHDTIMYVIRAADLLHLPVFFSIRTLQNCLAPAEFETCFDQTLRIRLRHFCIECGSFQRLFLSNFPGSKIVGKKNSICVFVEYVIDIFSFF